MQPIALLVIIKGKSFPTNWFEEKFLQPTMWQLILVA